MWYNKRKANNTLGYQVTHWVGGNMRNNSTDEGKSNQIIDDVEVTDDVLTSRAGLTLFVRYLRNITLFPYMEQLFGPIRKSCKGQAIGEIFKQLFCFLIDGTSRHLVYFDTLKKDEGYAKTIESDSAHLLSSHSVKRFYKSLWFPSTHLFRRVLLKLFGWRLQIVKPSVIILGVDTMVMDNDEAEKREGVKPTYKKEKGFQPLQMTWMRFMVDAIFRSGDKHSNHGTDVEKMVRRMVTFIRKEYSQEVPIIIRLDSGFFDQKLFKVFESLKVGYICGGKLYEDIKVQVTKMDPTSWDRFKNRNQVWEHVEFMDRRDSWDQSRRAIFCHPLYKEQQMLLNFARPDTMIYTNLGMGTELDKELVKAGMEKMLTAQGIIEAYHDRGGDELVNRALKDFGSEQLPFKRFHQNAAFYFTMLIGFFIYEAFKEDVCGSVVEVSSYATTLRRKIIDVAGKIVHHAKKTTLKITQAAWQALDFYQLWIKSENPIPIGQT
jgi:hypothetical protein